jgi:predicted enzyme related to lactoylglutathione lyase
VQLFVSVADVKGASAKAEALGAKVLIPATVLPEGDEMAVLLDTNGLSFAVWRGAQR